MNYQTKPKYYARPRANGEHTHYLDLGKINGKRVRRKYESKKQALEEIAKIQKQRLERGNNSFVTDNLILRAEVVKCLGLLQPHSCPLLKAVEFYVNFQGNKPERMATIGEAVTLWEKSRIEKGNRPHSVKKTVDTYYKPFIKSFKASQNVSTLQREEIKKYLGKNKRWAALTYNNHLNNLSILFNYLLKEKLATVSPTATIEHRKKEEQEVKLLSPLQVKTALLYCLKKKKYNCAAQIALVTFCGVSDSFKPIQKIETTI